MPTFNQLVRKGRQTVEKKSTAPALQRSFNSLKKKPRAVRSQLFIGKAFIAEESFRHIVVIERYAHRIAPFSGFVTHIVFTILL